MSKSGQDTNLSIVIVSWNTRDVLGKCLDSIEQNPPERDYELLVIDNASTDGSAEMVRERHPRVDLLVNPANYGFAKANNLAIQRCRGRYILLLNPDTEVRPGALEHLARFLEENPEAGAAGSLTLNPDGSLQISCYPRPTLFREFWRLFHLDRFRPVAEYPMARWKLDRPQEVDVLMGACLMLRREALDQVGLLDEDYFIYSEEVDLCYRVQRAGWRLYWVPQARIVHYGGQSTSQAAEEMFLQLYRGKILYFRKHSSWAAVWIYKLILFLASLGRLALTPLAYLEAPGRREGHLNLSQNYRRLLAALPGF